jgi:hypothetical protein
MSFSGTVCGRIETVLVRKVVGLWFALPQRCKWIYRYFALHDRTQAGSLCYVALRRVERFLKDTLPGGPQTHGDHATANVA